MSGVIVKNSVQAMSVDSLNRAAVAAADLDNGSVVILSGKTGAAGENEVWTAAQPVTGTLSNLWMVASPEMPITVSGTKKYRGLSPDPRDFVNLTGQYLDVFKPQLGDIVTLTDDALGGIKGANTFVVATNATYKLNWAAAAVAGLSLKLLRTTYISIPDGSIGTQRVVAYEFEVVAI